MLIYTVIAVSAISAGFICFGTEAFASLVWLWMLPVSFLGCLLGLSLVIFLLVWLLSVIIRLDKPQEKDSPFYRWLLNTLAKAAMVLLRMRVHTRGMEMTPKDGRFLLVCNHLNNLDPVTLLAYFSKSQLAFISKRENNRLFIAGKLMHKIMCQPINRENDREAMKTILKCIELLKRDEVSIGVFPEGYTSMDEKLHPFRHGVFKIAQKAQVPIVVCTLQNTQKVFRNAVRLKPTDVHLHLLAVIPPEEIKGVTAVDVGERAYRMMVEDLGPENVLPR